MFSRIRFFLELILIGYLLFQVHFCLNDSSAALDTAMPYLLGQTIGYGRPSLATSGTFRGAYNSANQVLAAMTTDKVR